MSFILPVLLAISWLFPSNMPRQTAVVPEMAQKNFQKCPADEHVYASIGESSVKLQPWLLSTQAESSAMEKSWQSFYQNLPAELRSAILPPQVLYLSEKDLIKGEAFADQLHVSQLRKRLGDLEASIPVVYTNFHFGNLLRKESGVYLRQHYQFLSSESSFGAYSSESERQFLTWLAYVNI